MNRQRKVVITITYNEMGIIIDTKAEEVAQPNLQSTCNELATDCVSRQAAIDGVKTLHDVAWKNWHEPTLSANVVLDMIRELPSAQPEQRWIPCSERLPEEPFGCLVTVWDTNHVTMDEFENILPYFVGWDGEQWNDADGEQCPFEVIAWMPLPEPYQEERREE